MVGQTISHYRILEKLGAGGMGVVYRAEDIKLKRTVALKFLPSELTRDEDSKRRFAHEAQAASALHHNNICVIHDIDETPEGQMFISMEYCEGETLKEKIERGPLKIEDAVNLGIQIAQGLEEAHEHQIVHRDVKPANVLITSGGVAKIVDFGLAKLSSATKITKTGSTLGTVAYMSPEQLQGSDVDPRADIFSFGIVLYELLSGRLPFRGEHQAAIMYSLINEDPPPIARFNDKVTVDLERIVLKAIAKDKEERYQHTGDLLADLRHERKKLEYLKIGATKPAAVNGTGLVARLSSGRGKYLSVIVAAALILTAVIFNPFKIEFGSKEDKPFIAVLPFTNQGDDKADSSYCDGVAEDILTQLSKIGDLNVASWSSSLRYKGTRKTTKDLGKELGVSSILEGSIRRVGDHVHVTGQLVDAASDRVIWAENYDRDTKDIFEIQSSLAENIASALETKLSASEKESIEKRPTQNTEAYDYYNRAREYYYRIHKQDNESAIELFKRALAVDPDYALAYAGLGDCYGQRAIRYGYSENWIDSGIVAGQRAVFLDPHLAEGYKALGLCYLGNGYFTRALDAQQEAIVWNPKYLPAINNMSIAHVFRGEIAEAYRWATRGATVSVKDPFTCFELGQIYYSLVEDEKAERWARKALSVQPDFMPSRWLLSRLSFARGDFQEARKKPQEILSMEPNSPAVDNLAGTVELCAENYSAAEKFFRKSLSWHVLWADWNFPRLSATGLGFCLIKLRNRGEGLRLLDEIRGLLENSIRRGSEAPNARYELAAVAAAEGKPTEAFDWLHKAIDLGWRDYRFTQRDPMLESLRQDRQFPMIIADMKGRVEEQRKLVNAMEER